MYETHRTATKLGITKARELTTFEYDHSKKAQVTTDNRIKVTKPNKWFVETNSLRFSSNNRSSHWRCSIKKLFLNNFCKKNYY